MSQCANCECDLPGEETLCRSCYNDQYFAVKRPRETLDRQLGHFIKVAPVTSALIAINVVIFILMTWSAQYRNASDIDQLIRWGADYGPLTAGGQWWRLFASTFLHAGPMHLLFNMQCLAFLGMISERAFGKSAFLLAYIGTGICASMLNQFLHPIQVCVGASGAIFGIAGCLLTPVALRRLSITVKGLSNPLKSLLVFAAFNLILGAITRGISNAAHVGGLVSGLLLGFVFAARYRSVAVETGPRQQLSQS